MKNVTQKLSLILAILLLTSTVAIYLPTATAVDAELYTVDDPVVKVWADKDTNFWLSVAVRNVIDLYGFDIKLEWNSALISYVAYDTSLGIDVIWGPVQGTNWYLVDDPHTAGSFKFAASSLAVEFDGTHELFRIQLHVEDPTCNSEKTTAIAFTTDKLATKVPAPITHTFDNGLYKITGMTPKINLSPTSKTCQMSITRDELPDGPGPEDVTEMFDVDASIADAQSVMGFSFDIRYDTTLLDSVSVTFDTLWTTTAYDNTTVDGSVSGSASAASGQTGTVPLMTIRLKPTSLHIWKDDSISDWTNELTDSIHIETATLTYSGAPTLSYPGGGITVLNAVAYTFSPIRGDLNNDGAIEIADLVTICHYYDVDEGDGLWSEAQAWDLVHFSGPKIIDIFDVIIIASNYDSKYSPPPP